MSHVPRRLIDNALFNLNLFSVATFWARRVDARVISNGILMDYVALSVCVCVGIAMSAPLIAFELFNY